MLNVIANNENSILCSTCGGRCCKEMPGEYHPSQFNLEDASLYLLVKGGEVAVDCWEGDTEDDGKLEQVYYIRPRIVGVLPGLDRSWGGQCANLTEAGCKLSFENRPYGCRALTPVKEMYPKCRSDWSKEHAARSWRLYQNIIENILDRLV